MSDSDPLVLLRAGTDCGKAGGESFWYYIAEPDVDRHWVAIAFAELEDMHDRCDLAHKQITFFRPGRGEEPEPGDFGRWHEGIHDVLTCDPTPEQRARLHY